jgi:hypothetical protein
MGEDKRRGRPKQETCYMGHPRVPTNLTKAGGCKKCKNENKKGKKNTLVRGRKIVSAFSARLSR